MPCIFSDWLALLGVSHTEAYSDRQFDRMSFRSLYGLSKLMQSYGVATAGLRLADRSEMAKLPVPFVAQTADGEMVIVRAFTPDAVIYLSQGATEQASRPQFDDAATGVVLLAQAGPDSREPDYSKHRFAEWMQKLRDVGLWVCLAALFVYAFVAHGLEGRWYTVLLTLFNIGGLALSFMLVQKTVGVHTRIAARVCGVLEQGGCDDILAGSASTFMGIFHWSEVGLAYFGVSLAVLLLFPGCLPDLALLNACCLPYTVWSITYQRFVAHRWCTLCVGVQTTLWLLFFCYLGGGCFAGAWPPSLTTLAIAMAYVGTVFALNKYSPVLKCLYNNEESEHQTDDSGTDSSAS